MGIPVDESTTTFCKPGRAENCYVCGKPPEGAQEANMGEHMQASEVLRVRRDGRNQALREVLEWAKTHKGKWVKNAAGFQHELPGAVCDAGSLEAKLGVMIDA